MKRVLIIGKESYIGESIFKWLKLYPQKYKVAIISPLNYQWKEIDFSQYEIVINLAGIAHIKNIKKNMRNLFYSINRDLTIEIGEHAKKRGIKYFINFSSMNVYGDYAQVVEDRDKVNPTSFYGDSKLQGEIGLKKLEDSNFIVANIRPPFVYGKGCKGNYNTISKIAKKIPIFPTYKNKKSMIYIDNLCEFIRLLIEDGVGGVYTPQNKELVSTFDLVREIANVKNHQIKYVCYFNWAIPFVMRFFGVVKKAFIDDSYDLKLSNYYNFRYCVVDFITSIKRTEI